MDLGLHRSWQTAILTLTGASFLFACTVGDASTTKKKGADDDFDFWDDAPSAIAEPMAPDNVNTNSGAFGAAERPSDTRDAGTVTPKPDGGTLPKTYCGSSLAQGDLAIVEIMISSKAGSADWGEWVEIQSTRDCWLKLQGVAVESPRGASAPNIATITDDFELAPRGTFLVAGSADPVKNHGLPGKVVAWEASDVLKNDGDTLSVKLGTMTIDTLTYPALSNVTAGRAIAFPADCARLDRTTWARWSLAFGEFGPGLKGTPNAANTDVACF